MKRLKVLPLVLALAWAAGGLRADDKDLAKEWPLVSQFTSVVNDEKAMNDLVYVRFGWNPQTPHLAALQFVNLGYKDHQLRFAVKDTTSKKNVELDPVRHSAFGTETLKAGSKGLIWLGKVDHLNDPLTLRVWVDGGEEMEKDPVSVRALKGSN